ncbi:ribosome biogenesis protein SLX9 homolog [Diabrotica virgifera virgifera]|uniref:Ribosome biogenesis protein SLX9 n=1 Tax=Diabrotica virgifera virgifera TaxID=50390 RepID=A0ABM5K108_DIAVI|nr:ribosome biogenesis protein SLX9 homolog [Diabrotica virgifera virgifera]
MGKVKKPKAKALGAFESKNNSAPIKESISANFDFSIKQGKSVVADDVKSVLSYKSIKSHNPINRIIKKKEKVNLKRKLLMKKIDLGNVLKKEQKIRDKRKNTSLIGDTNPLHDALPSLDSLLKKKSDLDYQASKEPKKKKGVEKATKRKKKLTSNMEFYKRAIKDTTFKKNPFAVISQHVQAVVQQERCKIN